MLNMNEVIKHIKAYTADMSGEMFGWLAGVSAEMTAACLSHISVT